MAIQETENLQQRQSKPWERERESLVAYLYLKEKRVKRPRGKEVKVEERNRGEERDWEVRRVLRWGERKKE